MADPQSAEKGKEKQKAKDKGKGVKLLSTDSKPQPHEQPQPRRGQCPCFPDPQKNSIVPPGCQFHPKDHELIQYYLIPKIKDKPLPPIAIHETNLYSSDFDLEDLADNFEPQAEGEWYFFTRRERLHKGGSRPKRTAGAGFWKATRSNKINCECGKQVGTMKTLVYCRGNRPDEEKTDWKMHEYEVCNGGRLSHQKRVESSLPIKKRQASQKSFKHHVLCRITKVDTKTENKAGIDEHKTVADADDVPGTQQLLPPTGLVDSPTIGLPAPFDVSCTRNQVEDSSTIRHCSSSGSVKSDAEARSEEK